MKGYYEGNGLGLPHGENVTAILDGVIVFSLKKSESESRLFLIPPTAGMRRGFPNTP